MSKNKESEKDPTILECCLKASNQEPYIGVDEKCDKSAIFCIEHSSHVNEEGLIHQMMPLKIFKRTVHSKKFIMQEKIEHLIDNFNRFMESLIEHIQELKLRKSIELSMLWLRELASNEEEYELMRQVYRMDFRGLSCQDIHSIYYKIIHNDALYQKDLSEIKCYEGISKILQDLGNNQKAQKLITQKMTEIQGLLDNSRILQKLLPDKRILRPHIKQIMLEEHPDNHNFDVNYHKAQLTVNSTKFMSLFSKYPIIPHVTYHIFIKTKYSNVMLGVCNKSVKQNNGEVDQHYNVNSIVYNCANGCVYKKGLFSSGAGAEVKGMNELVIKLRLTQKQIILMTKEKVLMRSKISNLEDESGELFLHVLGRTKSDYFEFERDKQVSADNLKLIKTLQSNISEGMEEQLYETLYTKKSLNKNPVLEQPRYDNIQNVQISHSLEQYLPPNPKYMQQQKQFAQKIEKKRFNTQKSDESLHQETTMTKNMSKHPVLPSFLSKSDSQFSCSGQRVTDKALGSSGPLNEKKKSDSQITDPTMKMTLLTNKNEKKAKTSQSHAPKVPRIQINQPNNYLNSYLEIESSKGSGHMKSAHFGTQSVDSNAFSLEQIKNKLQHLNPNFTKDSKDSNPPKFQFNSIYHIPERSELSDDGKSYSKNYGQGSSSQRNDEINLAFSNKVYNPPDASRFQIEVSEENSYANQIDTSKKRNENLSNSTGREVYNRDKLKIIKTPPKISELGKKQFDLSSPESAIYKI